MGEQIDLHPALDVIGDQSSQLHRPDRRPCAQFLLAGLAPYPSGADSVTVCLVARQSGLDHACIDQDLARIYSFNWPGIYVNGY